jgi:MscS family membrane protein
MPPVSSASVPWLSQHMPPALQAPGPLSLAWWQWLGLPIVAAIAFVAAMVVATVLVRLGNRIARETVATWDDALAPRLRGPLWLALTSAFSKVLSFALELEADSRGVVNQVLIAAVTFAVFWGLLRSIDVISVALSTSPWAQRSTASTTLIPLGRRFSKLLLSLLAVASALSILGVPVASVIAGLGVGGLAVALAAQKTFENLLGAFAIGADQPFREGDTIKVDDVVGTVERVGLRSTQIRTGERTVVSIPNGQLAEKRIETFAARDRLRFAVVVTIAYDTTPAQVRTLLTSIEALLRAEELMSPTDVGARVLGFGPVGLDLEVQGYLLTTDSTVFATTKTRLLLSIMEHVTKSGSTFAAARKPV